MDNRFLKTIVVVVLVVLLAGNVFFIFDKISRNRKDDQTTAKIDSLTIVSAVANSKADESKKIADDSQKRSDSLFNLWKNRKPSQENQREYEKQIQINHSASATDNARRLHEWANQP